jgi:inner membrane protein
LDSITHIAVGACIGEAFFEKGFGKRAMIWGILAQSIPDIDFVASFWMDTADNLLAHRGFTHSILFAVLATPLFALAADKIHRPQQSHFGRWLLFFATEISVHLLLDTFNNYGVGLFEPFSNERFSFNTIYVLDPFFSMWPVIACVMLYVLHGFHRTRRFWWMFGLIIPALYLMYCSYNKLTVNARVKEHIEVNQLNDKHYFSTPAPMQNWLWFVAIGNDDGYQIGYTTVLENEKPMKLTHFPKNDSLLNAVKDKAELEQLIRFSQGYYTVEKWSDTLVFNDLRFGQIQGWEYPDQKFVFHYFLERPRSNDLVVQRGRLTGWTRESLISYWNRIRAIKN